MVFIRRSITYSIVIFIFGSILTSVIARDDNNLKVDKADHLEKGFRNYLVTISLFRITLK